MADRKKVFTRVSVCFLVFKVLYYRPLAIVILVFLFLSPISAQYLDPSNTPCPSGPDVSLDTLFYRPDNTMPFDRCFYLKVNLPEKISVDGFMVVPVDKRGNISATRRDFRVFTKSGWRQKGTVISRLINRKHRNKSRRKQLVSRNIFFKYNRRSYKYLLKQYAEDEVLKEPTTTRSNLENKVTSKVKELKKIKSSGKSKPYSFKSFKDSSLVQTHLFFHNGGNRRFFRSVHTTYKEEKTELVLRMPPLEPGREYKILLSTKSSKQVNELRIVADMIYKAELSKDDSLQLVTRSKRKFNHIHTLRKNSEDHILSQMSFEEFRQSLVRSTLSVNRKISFSKPTLTYRLILTPETKTPLSSAQAKKLDTLHYNDQISRADPVQLSLGYPLYSSDGDTINFFGTSCYHVQYLALEDTSSISFDTIGILEFTGSLQSPNFYVRNDLIDKESLKLRIGILPEIPQVIQAQEEQKKVEKAIKNIPSNFFSFFDIKHTLNVLASKWDDNQILIDSITLKKTIELVSKIQSDSFTIHFALGLINQIDTNKPKSITPSTRLANTKKNLATIIQTKSSLDLLALFHQCQSIQSIADSIGKMHILMTQLESNIKKQIDKNSNINNSLSNMFPSIYKNSNPIGSSSLLSLKGRTAFRITPDFGLTAAFRGSKDLAIQDMIPYLGFHINLRPIDKNLALRQIRFKSFWHRTSISAGISLTSVSLDNTREDFFNNNSLLLGIGYRLTNYWKISLGTLWFKSKSYNPFSSSKNLRFVPTIGTSIDLEVEELFGGISKLFK